MKKSIIIILSISLVLGACSNKQAEKKEEKTTHNQHNKDLKKKKH